MWGANLSDLPRFYDYASAHKFYRSTKPVRTSGAIPLRSNRRQHDRYAIVAGRDSHGEYIACRHYRTELVKFYENGNIGIYPYNSRSSRDFISSVSPFQLSTSLNWPVLNGAYSGHFLTGVEVKLRPRSSEERRTGWGRTSASWVIDNPKAAVGVRIGPGRAYIDKKVGALMRAAKKQRKAMALFAGVQSVDEIHALRPYRETFGKDDVARVAHGWRKGDEIPMWLTAARQYTFETFDASLRYEIKADLCRAQDVSDWYKARDMLEREGSLLDPQGVLEREDWIHGIIV